MQKTTFLLLFLSFFGAVTQVCAEDAPSLPVEQVEELEDYIEPLFEANDFPQEPNVIQKALVFFTGTQQSHWTVENCIKFYSPLVAACYFSQLSDANQEYLNAGAGWPTGHHLNQAVLKYYLSGAVQHYLTDKRVEGMGNALYKSFATTFLVDHAVLGNLFKKDGFRYQLKGLGFSYYFKRLLMRWIRADNTQTTLSLIEAECKKMGIESGVTRGSVPENENYLLVESPRAIWLDLLRSISGVFNFDRRNSSNLWLGLDYDFKRMLAFYLSSGKAIEVERPWSESVSKSTFWLIIGIKVMLGLVYAREYFCGRYIIPYETISKLSPELQDRCYDLMWLNKTQL
jgi:hypothetical protein